MLGWAQGTEASGGGGKDPGKRGWSWHSPYSRPRSMGICLPSAAAHLSRHTDTFSLPFIHPLIHTTRVEAVLGGGGAPKIHLHLEPQNGTLFGNRIFADTFS